MKRFQSWLQNRAPIQDPVRQQQAPAFQIMILSLVVFNTCLLFILAFSALFNPIDITSFMKILSTGIGLLICFFCLWLLRRGSFNGAVIVLVGTMLILFTLNYIQVGFRSNWTLNFGLIIPITFIGLLSSRRGIWAGIGLIMLIIISIHLFAAFQPDTTGIAAKNDLLSVQEISMGVFGLLVVGLCYDHFALALQRSMSAALERQNELEQVRSNQEELIANRTSELRGSLQTVEQREQQLAQTLVELRQSQDIIVNLSAPIIPVLPGVLTIPLIGALDSKRAQALTNNLLSLVEQQRARAVIFDITGMDIVDTQVAQVLMRTATAATLLGAKVMLVGIRPELAQTMVALGVNMRAFTTYNNLQTAVMQLLLQNGWQQPTSLSQYKQVAY